MGKMQQTKAQIEQPMEVPDDVLEAMARLGRAARNRGQHVKCSSSSGRKRLVRSDCLPGNVKVSDKKVATSVRSERDLKTDHMLQSLQGQLLELNSLRNPAAMRRRLAPGHSRCLQPEFASGTSAFWRSYMQDS